MLYDLGLGWLSSFVPFRIRTSNGEGCPRASVPELHKPRSRIESVTVHVYVRQNQIYC